LSELLTCWTRDPGARDVAVHLVAHRPLALPDRLVGAGGATVSMQAVPGAGGTAWEQTRLPRAIRGGADVLFGPGYSAPLLSPLPTVVAIHDVSFFAHPEWFSLREGLRRRLITRLAARRAARVLTLSEFSKDQIARFTGVPRDRITVTPAGSGGYVGRAAERIGHDAAGPLVLYVGSILNRRQVPLLVRAFAPVARRRPQARLIIVGENRTFPFEDPDLAARQAGIAGQVECRAFVPDVELAGLYARATVFVFLSTYEGFGLTPLEAMSAGVPVVACDTPVAREVYGDAAILVPPGDEEAVTLAIERALDDPALRARLDAAARVRLASLPWERTAALVLDALREAAGR
jgi:glycosyltransferase involved in cell wall biosynthesis